MHSKEKSLQLDNDAIKEYNRVHGKGRAKVFLTILLKMIHYKFNTNVIRLRIKGL